jgi:hypothetical protein
MKYLIPLLLISTSALAQQQPGPCASKEKTHELLTKQYGEKPFVEMKDNFGRQFVMYVNPNSGTWTVIVTKDDMSCGVSAGKDLTPVDPKRFEQKKSDPS